MAGRSGGKSWLNLARGVLLALSTMLVWSGLHAGPVRSVILIWNHQAGPFFLQRVRGHKFARDACAMDARNQYNRFNDSTAGSKKVNTTFTVSCLDTNTGLESPLPNR